MVGSDANENTSYSDILGDYFDVISTIAAIENRHDDAELSNRDTYSSLIESRERLRQRLDEYSETREKSDIEQVLDEAFEGLQ